MCLLGIVLIQLAKNKRQQPQSKQINFFLEIFIRDGPEIILITRFTRCKNMSVSGRNKRLLSANAD